MNGYLNDLRVIEYCAFFVIFAWKLRRFSVHTDYPCSTNIRTTLIAHIFFLRWLFCKILSIFFGFPSINNLRRKLNVKLTQNMVKSGQLRLDITFHPAVQFSYSMVLGLTTDIRLLYFFVRVDYITHGVNFHGRTKPKNKNLAPCCVSLSSWLVNHGARIFILVLMVA